MSVRFETEALDFYCPYCDTAMVETGCVAPRCDALTCPQCQVGCDLDDEGEGFCAMAQNRMTYAQRLDAQQEKRLYAVHGRPVRTVNLP